MLYPRRKFIITGAALAMLAKRAVGEPKGFAPMTKVGAGVAALAGAVPVGAMFATSGPDSLLGDECWRGVQLAAAATNAAGGIKGKRLLMVPGDAFISAQSEAAAGQFITAQHFGFLLGSGGSNFCYPGSAAAELAQLPYIELSAPADGITGRGFKFLLRTALTTTMVAQVAVAGIAARFPGKAIGVLFNNGADAGAIAAAALALWGQGNAAVRLSIGYSEDAADLHNPVARLQRAGVEVVLHAAGADDVLQMFQAAHDVGFKPAAVFGCGGGYGLRETALAVGPAFEGTFVSAAPFYPEQAGYIVDAYKAQFGMVPRAAESLTSYVGAKLVFDVLNQCDGDTSKLLDTLRKSDIAAGTLANGWGAAFDKTGQNTRAFASLQQWQGQILANIA